MSDTTYKALESAAGGCNSIVAHGCAKCGAKVLKRYYSAGPTGLILLGVDICRNPENAFSTAASYGASTIVSTAVTTMCAPLGFGAPVVGAVAGFITSLFMD